MQLTLTLRWECEAERRGCRLNSSSGCIWREQNGVRVLTGETLRCAGSKNREGGDRRAVDLGLGVVPRPVNN